MYLARTISARADCCCRDAAEVDDAANVDDDAGLDCDGDERGDSITPYVQVVTKAERIGSSRSSPSGEQCINQSVPARQCESDDDVPPFDPSVSALTRQKQ